jgi:hypothetical protein
MNQIFYPLFIIITEVLKLVDLSVNIFFLFKYWSENLNWKYLNIFLSISIKSYEIFTWFQFINFDWLKSENQIKKM